MLLYSHLRYQKSRYLSIKSRFFSSHAEFAAIAENLTSSASNPSSISSTHTTSSSTASLSLSQPKIGIQTSKYSINLSKLAMDGKLDPVIGRSEEVGRAIQILSRRTKNNPCFIGEPGVGKTALAEELARKICYGEVPEYFKNKVILALDLPSMLAGTKFRGEFEERFKGVLKEIESSGDRIILFIDELHIIAGAGGSEGAIDASNILKPSLTRGFLRCMGATTTNEYRKYIEKDAALARRFQPIFVAEPSLETVTDIIKGLREKYELFHHIIISDEAINAAINFSHKYITDRRFPDKAIDLLDEAGSRLKIEIESFSKNLLSENPSASIDIWNSYKLKLSNFFSIKAKLTELIADRQLAQHQGNTERVQFIDNIEMKDATKLLKEYEEEISANLKLLQQAYANSSWLRSRHPLPPHVLTSIDIAHVITKQTGIPVGALLASEKQSLLNMEAELRTRVLGQDEAIQAICRCIRLSRAGLRYHDRPLGVFLMIGGTGTGKTEIAKALSEYLFHDANATHMLRIDMSEYMEKFSVSRLIGAPPGYVGYDEGGTLTESVRRRPYQVILLDEFEKAHREVSNLLLQVFDEGRLSDSQGRVIDFRNTVIIMTSNLQSQTLLDMKFDDKASKSSTARKIVSEHFAPEFVNRVDEVIVFDRLSMETIHQIANIQLKKVEKLLSDRQIRIQFSDSLLRWISETGFDPHYGARPLKRLIQRKILNPLATILLEDRLKAGDMVKISMNQDHSEGEESGIAGLLWEEEGEDNNANRIYFVKDS
jgi:ATP-dependent Clp protease ATP-binding subunit ClpB